MKFTFTDDSWWDDNGCSCCEPILMACYNSDDTEPSLGSAHSTEDCYAQALITFKGYDNISDDHMSEIYQMSLDELKADCKQYGIKVKINYDH